jgi:hypothetical protein
VKTYLFEAVQQHGKPQNWGKFMVGVPDAEWFRESLVDPVGGRYPLLEQIGWTQNHVWVMDLQTGEGAWFRHGGLARADLEKHRIWVCPLFEEFLKWLYAQDLAGLHLLPGVIELPDAQFSINGYRRPGPHDVVFTLRKGDLMRIEWERGKDGVRQLRTVICEGFDEHGDALIRSLTDEEAAAVGKHTELGVETQEDPWTTESLERALGLPDGPVPQLGVHREVLAERMAHPELDDTLSIGPLDEDTEA